MKKEDLKSLYWLKKEIQREKLNSSGSSRMKELQRRYDEIRREIYSVKDTQVRVILLLRYVDGMSWKSIAQRLGGGNGPALFWLAASVIEYLAAVKYKEKTE